MWAASSVLEIVAVGAVVCVSMTIPMSTGHAIGDPEREKAQIRAFHHLQAM